MEVTLPPDLQAFVDDMVGEDGYGARGYVIEAGLRLLMAQEAFRRSEIARVRALVQEGIDDLDAGRSRDGEEVMLELRERLEKMAAGEAERVA